MSLCITHHTYTHTHTHTHTHLYKSSKYQILASDRNWAVTPRRILSIKVWVEEFDVTWCKCLFRYFSTLTRIDNVFCSVFVFCFFVRPLFIIYKTKQILTLFYSQVKIKENIIVSNTSGCNRGEVLKESVQYVSNQQLQCKTAQLVTFFMSSLKWIHTRTHTQTQGKLGTNSFTYETCHFFRAKISQQMKHLINTAYLIGTNAFCLSTHTHTHTHTHVWQTQ